MKKEVENLKPKLTDSFLETLGEALCVVGWGVDFIESAQFVERVYELADRKAPAFQPVDYEDT